MKLPKYLRKRKTLAAIVAGCLIVAYFAVPYAHVSENARLDMQEAVIRYLLHHNASGLQERLQVCFVGIGSSFDQVEPRDPPSGFIERFDDFPVPVHPVSQAVHAPPQRPGYIDSSDGGMFSHVADTKGRPGLIFAAGDVTRYSVGIAVCRGLYDEAVLSAAEYDVYLIWTPFGWIAIRAKLLWIS
jgi:hypothetical protein